MKHVKNACTASVIVPTYNRKKLLKYTLNSLEKQSTDPKSFETIVVDDGSSDDTHELKAWKVIDDAGLRGATLGGAQMSEKHPNFLINANKATAADLENLGELVREKVFQHAGIRLEWEIMRVGEAAAAED